MTASGVQVRLTGRRLLNVVLTFSRSPPQIIDRHRAMEEAAKLRRPADRRQSDFQPGDAPSYRFQESVFSRDGLQSLEKKAKEYSVDLTNLSRSLARQENLDITGKPHVEQAARLLTTRPKNRIWRYIGQFGTLLLGASMSFILTDLSYVPNNPHDWSHLVAYLVGLAGALMFGLSARH